MDNTLRNTLAAHALEGMLASGLFGRDTEEMFCSRVWDIADAMLRALPASAPDPRDDALRLTEEALRPFGGLAKKKNGETNAVDAQLPKSRELSESRRRPRCHHEVQGGQRSDQACPPDT
jgi:hypothetical protein